MAVYSQTVWGILSKKLLSICLIIPQNRKVKKNSTSHYQSKCVDKLPIKAGRPWREKGGAHFMQAWWCQKDLPSLIYTKEGPAGKLIWSEPPETILIIVDETTYRDPAPKTLDELRQWLRFAWKNVTLDTLWELVHNLYLTA